MKSAGPAISAMLLVLATLLLLYVLLLGPAIRLHHQGILTRPIEIVYTPLEWAARHMPIVEYTLRPYVSLWAPDISTPPPAAAAPSPAPVAPPAPVPAAVPAPAGN